MKWIAMLLIIFVAANAQAQELPVLTEEMMEQMADNAEEEKDLSEVEEQYQQWLKHKININSDEMKEIEIAGLITALQLRQLVQYRTSFGDLIDVYELQAVPGFDVHTFNSIKAFLTCSVSEQRSIKQMLRSGEHQIIWRVTSTLEKAKGYITNAEGVTAYSGSRERSLFRYRFSYNKVLQWQILAEKDPGEKLWSNGMDFISAHLQYKPGKFVQKIIVGDYTVNFGCSLIQWQGFSIGGDVVGLKPQGETIRAYTGAGEYMFHRGIAASLKWRKWQLHLFGSHRKLDGNLKSDSAYKYVTSIQTSGLHRTDAELEDRGVLLQTTAGISLMRKWKKWLVGFNKLEQRYNLPIIPQNAVYNTFALSGDKVSAQSVDFTFYGNHYQLFGELATINGARGGVVGAMISVSPFTDVGIRLRSLSKDFSGKDNNVISKSSNGNNETGIMCLLQIRTNKRLSINASFDVFRFPYFKFRVHGPSVGFEHKIMLHYKPNKQFEGYVMMNANTREQNVEIDEEYIPVVGVNRSLRYRVNLQWKLNEFLLRTRMEAKSFLPEYGFEEHGVIIYVDTRYLPMGKPYKLSARLQYFHTTFDTRIYAYENDLHPGNTIPQVNGKGVRVYLTGSYKMRNGITASFKIARTMYSDREEIGSGNETIFSSHKTQAGLQLQLQL